jgi:hypothetical protein
MVSVRIRHENPKYKANCKPVTAIVANYEHAETACKYASLPCRGAWGGVIFSSTLILKHKNLGRRVGRGHNRVKIWQKIISRGVFTMRATADYIKKNN